MQVVDFQREKFLAWDCICPVFVSFVVCPAPSDQPAGLYFARVLYNAHVRAWGLSVQHFPLHF